MKIETYKIYFFRIGDGMYHLLGELNIPYCIDDIKNALKCVKNRHYDKFSLIGFKGRTSLFFNFTRFDEINPEDINSSFKTAEELKSNPKYDFYESRHSSLKVVDLYCETDFAEVFKEVCI